MAAFGLFTETESPEFREGVKRFENKKTDIFFINLNKSEKDFSPSTMYEDYAELHLLQKFPLGLTQFLHRYFGNRI